MKSRRTERLRNIEHDLILEIRTLRNSPDASLPATLLENPEQLIHHFIRASHGNVQVRIRPLARELGIEMRTLERLFAIRYQTTMAECQVSVRLEFSRWMLSISPPAKISVIAALLGYARVQEFNRFFRGHTGHSPIEWRSTHLEEVSDEDR